VPETGALHTREFAEAPFGCRARGLVWGVKGPSLTPSTLLTDPAHVSAARGSSRELGRRELETESCRLPYPGEGRSESLRRPARSARPPYRRTGYLQRGATRIVEGKHLRDDTVIGG